MPPEDDTAPLDRFLSRFWDDRQKGVHRELSHYLSEFPGDDEGIAREYEALAAMESGSRTVVESDLKRGDPSPRKSHFVGPYKIIRELGRGGQGLVYLAADERVGRKVALKMMTRWMGPLAGPTFERFRREARLASKLAHPGLCTVYDTGLDGETPWIAMQYVEGTTLASRLAAFRKGGKEPSEAGTFHVDMPTRAEFATTPAGDEKATQTAVAPKGGADSAAPSTGSPSSSSSHSTPAYVRQILAFFEKASRALHVAHEAGVVHRDIKPGNIMITPSGDPVVLDFGLARDTNESESAILTRSGDELGTPAYMSPEQVQGHAAAVDRRSDVFSLGVSLYECLTLERPFQAATRRGLYDSIVNDAAVDPSSRNPAISRDLSAILSVAIEKDPNRRYQTAEDLADDLQRLLQKEPVRARPIGPWIRFQRWTQRNPKLAIAVCGILVASVLGTAFSLSFAGRAARNLKRAEEAKQVAEASAFDARMKSARENGRYGRWLEALADLDFAAGIPGADPIEIALARVDALIGSLDPDGAAAIVKGIDDASATPTQRARLLLVRGDIAADRDANPQAGIDSIQAALATGLLAPADAFYAQAMLAPKATDALAFIRQALAADPYHRRANEYCGTLLIVMGLDDQAREFAAAYKSIFPGDPFCVIFDAGTQVLDGDLNTGLETLKQLEGKLPKEDRRFVEDTVRCLDAFNLFGDTLLSQALGSEEARTRNQKRFTTLLALTLRLNSTQKVKRGKVVSPHLAPFAYDSLLPAAKVLLDLTKINLGAKKTDVRASIERLRKAQENLPSPMLKLMEAAITSIHDMDEDSLRAVKEYEAMGSKSRWDSGVAGFTYLAWMKRWVELKDKDPAAAAAAGKKGIETLPVLLEYEDLANFHYPNFADAALIFGDGKLAQQVVDTWRLRWPEDRLWGRYQARVHLANGNPGDALKVIREYRVQAPDDADAAALEKKAEEELRSILDGGSGKR